MSFHSIAKKPSRQLAPGVLEVWKLRGETLSALVRRIRSEERIGDDVPVTYAGRLDPMAEGLVLLLFGDARFEKEKYLGLGKTYEFRILFGVATDTYDVLGVMTNTQIPMIEKVTKREVQKAIEEMKTTPLPYPPFSSKPVGGTPLFAHARAGTLPNEMPMQGSMPGAIAVIGEEGVRLGDIAADIIADIGRVEGDFRQEAIVKGWEALRARYADATLRMTDCTADVSSGVYIRSIAHAIGERIGIPALAYSIVRMRIGEKL